MELSMKNKIALFIMLLFVANVSYAELKVGVVNVAKVLQKSPQAKKAQQRMEKEFSPRKKRLETKVKEINQLEEKLNRDASVMGESERRKLEKDIFDKKREAKRIQQEFKEDISMWNNEEMGKIQRRVLDAIKALAKDEGFDLLLMDGVQNGVVYYTNKIDVTERVQKKLASLSD
jgi:outer membrane protein